MKTTLRLLGFLRPFAAAVTLSVLLGAGALAAGIGLLGTSAYLIATAALHPSIAVLQVAIVGVRAFGILRAALRYAERLATHSASLALLAKLRTWFFAAVLPLSPAQIQPTPSADLFTRATADLDSLENFYVRAVAPPLTALVVIGGAGLWMGSLHPALGMILVGGLVCAGLLLPLLTVGLSAAPAEAVTHERAAFQLELFDTLGGLDEWLVAGVAESFAARAFYAARALSHAQQRLARTAALINALFTLLNGLTLCAVLAFGIPLVGSTLDGVTLAVLALVTLSAFEAVTPLSASAQAFSSSLSAARRLFAIADQTPQIAPSDLKEKENVLLDAPLSLLIRDLSFSYSANLPPTLADFSLDLPAGKRIAILGESGAGKSTLFHLLLRLAEYSGGQISLNETDLRSLPPDDARACFAVLPQQVHLFSGTLRQNLTLGVRQAQDGQIFAALQTALLTDWVKNLPRGLDTWIGEGGATLSAGQRQRVGIARALLICQCRPAILLLDEPTAHLDPLTERAFWAAFWRQQPREQSLLCLTHRLVGLEHFDEIILMDHGKIAERGNYAQLLAHEGGLLRRLAQLQRAFL